MSRGGGPARAAGGPVQAAGDAAAELARRVARRMEADGVSATGDRVLVALSGGLDSLVLLHLLRFGHGVPEVRLEAAHFDHRMRPGSGADARWVAGLCRAWEVQLRTGRADTALSGEAEARRARYAFLEEARAAEGGWLLTAHHADDQAETVLFRAVRGTGLRGLRGIPPRRGRILRPLLPFWRDELEAYAAAAGLRAREDPTNLDRGYARNVLRHDVIPRLESGVAPGARAALVRLARLAREEEAGWRSVVEDALEEVVTEADEGRIVFARPAFSGYHRHVRARIVRALVRRLGYRLDEAGTRTAVEFITSGTSGGTIHLPGGLLLSREFDEIVLARDVPEPGRECIEIPGPDAGRETVRIGDRRLEVRWGAERPSADGWIEELRVSRASFPLRVRPWRPGDRIRLPYGTKKLKKLFSEARVPVRERGRRPVVVDRHGRVLWVAGVGVASPAGGGGRDEAAIFIAIGEAHGPAEGAE